ncbi:MAG: inositol-3-phosphate synthase [Promethearchaeota archaeon]
MEQIKIAIAGIGNLACSFVQGLQYYKNNSRKVGLLHPIMAGLKPKHLSVVAAFDVDERKVGKDLGEAIFSKPNVARKIIEVGNLGVKVLRAETKDGIINETKKYIEESNEKPVNVVDVLKNSGASMLLCLTPSSADETTKYYAQAALDAGVAFVNATTTFIASDEEWANKFKQASLPVVGDDLQNQAGATIIHKLVLEILASRGVNIKESYSLDVGGGIDSYNTLIREKARQQKRTIKSEAVSTAIGQPDAQIVAGTSDFVEHLENQRNTQIWIAGSYFNGAPLEIDMFIRTFDGDNGGAVLMDIVRATQIALMNEIGGPIKSISAYGFKYPPGGSKRPEQAINDLSQFILGNIAE